MTLSPLGLANKYIIGNAPPGSDIHGVTEKLAYKLYEVDKPIVEVSDSSNYYWFKAQEGLLQWSKDTPSHHTFPEHLSMCLKHEAYKFRNSEGTNFDHWIDGQKDLAGLILDRLPELSAAS